MIYTLLFLVVCVFGCVLLLVTPHLENLKMHLEAKRELKKNDKKDNKKMRRKKQLIKKVEELETELKELKEYIEFKEYGEEAQIYIGHSTGFLPTLYTIYLTWAEDMKLKRYKLDETLFLNKMRYKVDKVEDDIVYLSKHNYYGGEDVTNYEFDLTTQTLTEVKYRPEPKKSSRKTKPKVAEKETKTENTGKTKSKKESK